MSKILKIIAIVVMMSGFFTGCTRVIGETSSNGEGHGVEDSMANGNSEEMGNYSIGLNYAIGADGNYSVIGVGTCTDERIIIPHKYNGKDVTAIGEESFAYTEGIISITIPNSIKKIQPNAFFMCVDLVEAIFENTADWMVLKIESELSGEKLNLNEPTNAAILLTTTNRLSYWICT